MTAIQLSYDLSQLESAFSEKRAKRGGLSVSDLKIILKAARPRAKLAANATRKDVIAELKRAYATNALSSILRPVGTPQQVKIPCDIKSDLDFYNCTLFNSGYSYVVIPEDVTIYRGGNKGRDYSFYSTKEIGESYGRYTSLHTYNTTRPVYLLDLSNHSNLLHLLQDTDRFTKNEILQLRVYTGYNVRYIPSQNVVRTLEDNVDHKIYSLGCQNAMEFPLQICTEAFMTESDKKDEFYLSRKILKLICKKFDLDGFISFGILPRARDMPMNFHAEIGLCNLSKVQKVM